MLILHIGMPKTGTTSVQKFFYEKRAEISEYGITYPDLYCGPPFDWGQNSLATDILENPDGERARHFLDALSAEKNNNLFLSAESFFNGLSMDYRDRFIYFLKRCSKISGVLLVVFIRRFDSFVDASFRLEVQNGAINSFSIRDYAEARLPWFKGVLETLSLLSKAQELVALRVLPYTKGVDSVARLQAELLFPPALKAAVIGKNVENAKLGLKQLAVLAFFLEEIVSKAPAVDRWRLLGDFLSGERLIENDVYRYSLVENKFGAELHRHAIEISNFVFRPGYSDMFFDTNVDSDDSPFVKFENSIVSSDELAALVSSYQ